MELDHLLLAAGYGRRLRPLTDCLPKALLPIHGTPLLERHLAALHDARRIIINAHHLAEQITAYVQDHPRRDRIRLSHEPEIRGTGGALVQAGRLLRSDPVVVINADTLYTPPWEEAREHHRRGGYLATMILSPVALHRNVTAADGRVTDILLDRTDAAAFTFTGCHLIAQDLIARLPATGFHDIRSTYRELLREGSLGAYIDRRGTEIIDVGTPERYLEAHRVTRPPDGLRCAEEYGFIDPRAHIGVGARIRASVVMEEAMVAPHASLDQVIIAPRARAAGRLRRVIVTRADTHMF